MHVFGSAAAEEEEMKDRENNTDQCKSQRVAYCDEIKHHPWLSSCGHNEFHFAQLNAGRSPFLKMMVMDRLSVANFILYSTSAITSARHFTNFAVIVHIFCRYRSAHSCLQHNANMKFTIKYLSSMQLSVSNYVGRL